MSFGSRVSVTQRRLLLCLLLAVSAAGAVIASRLFVGSELGQEFVSEYPGYTEIPGAPQGAPSWIAWQHFFNALLLLLIFRTGWLIRSGQRPQYFWQSGRKPRGRMGIAAWLHLALDTLWLSNGIVYVVLLFSTSYWLRIVPTSWEVIPNAVSGAAQYLSFNWPAQDAWPSYGSLQQLGYFLTVFVAAPLALMSGARLSLYWPVHIVGLSRLFSHRAARMMHVAVMVYLVVFTVLHTALVLLTDPVNNLNRMFAASGDGTGNGVWMFLVALAVMAVSLILTHPKVTVKLAALFGVVTEARQPRS